MTKRYLLTTLVTSACLLWITACSDSESSGPQGLELYADSDWYEITSLELVDPLTDESAINTAISAAFNGLSGLMIGRHTSADAVDPTQADTLVVFAGVCDSNGCRNDQKPENSFIVAPLTSEATDSCAPDTTDLDSSATLNDPMGPCFSATPGASSSSLDVNLVEGATFKLQAPTIAGSDPASDGSISDGVMSGFVSKTDLDAITDAIEAQLSVTLPDPIFPDDTKDMRDGEEGWTMFFNFEAEARATVDIEN